MSLSLRTITASFLPLLASVLIHKSSYAQDTTMLESARVSGESVSVLQKEQASYYFSIKALDIAKSPSQTTADLLQENGNVLIQKSQQGGGSPILRGFEANKVLLVVDGVRMNNLIYRGGHLQNIITVDPLALEKIEVMLGQGSTLYGSDALGGVILLETRNTPEFSSQKKHEIQVASKYSTANKGLNLHADYGYSNSNIATFTSLSFSHYDDLRMGARLGRFPNLRSRDQYIIPVQNAQDQIATNEDPNLQRFSGYEQWDMLQKFSIQHQKNNISRINIQYSTTNDIPRYDRLTNRDSSGALLFAQWYYGPQMRFLTSYAYQKINASREIEWNTSLSYQNLKESRYKRTYRSQWLRSNEEHVQVFGILSDLRKKYSNGFINLGLDLNLGTVISVGYSKDLLTGQHSFHQSRYPDGNNTQINTAIFVLRHWNLSETSYLDIGGRLGYTQLNSQIKPDSPNPYLLSDFDQKNPVYSYDISWKKYLNPAWKISANIGTGYRVPNLDDLAKIFDSEPGFLIIPNTDLKPERTTNLNLNLSYQDQENIHWTFSQFVSRLHQAISTRPYTWEGQDSVMFDGIMSQVLANQNFNKAWLLGFNTQLDAKLLSHTSINFKLSYTYGQLTMSNTEQSPLDHIPPVIGRAGLRYEKARWDARLFVSFNGEKPLDRYSVNGEDNIRYAPLDSIGNPIGMPRWQTLNFQSSIHLSKGWMLDFGVHNIFDLRYQVFASGILASGRNAFLALRWKNNDP